MRSSDWSSDVCSSDLALEMGQADAREGRPRHEDDRDGGLSGMTETVETTENAARPIPASIPMPDHPIRHTRWWQMFVRLPRPALEWVTVGGVGYALIIGPAIQRPLGDGYLSQALLFAGGLFGVRAFEKVKGVR